MEVWDLIDRCHEPVISCTVSMAMVTSLCFSPPEEGPDSSAKPASHKQYLAVGRCFGFTILAVVSHPDGISARFEHLLAMFELLLRSSVG